MFESTEIKYSFSLPFTEMSTFLSSEITRGLQFKFYVQMGVKTKFLLSGIIIGPPQLRE